MEEMNKIRKKLEKEFDSAIEVNPESDIPVSERRTKDRKVRDI